MYELHEYPNDYWKKAIQRWYEAKFPEEEWGRVVRGFIDRAPEGDPIVEAILVEGFRSYAHNHRRALKLTKEEVSRQRKAKLSGAAKAAEKLKASSLALRTKASEFDKLVEMLDHMKVGDKLLGDCTKADLLREAVRLDQVAGEIGVHTAFLRRLAALVGPVGTVREVNDRAGVVALLTHEFREEAEAA